MTKIIQERRLVWKVKVCWVWPDRQLHVWHIHQLLFIRCWIEISLTRKSKDVFFASVWVFYIKDTVCLALWVILPPADKIKNVQPPTPKMFFLTLLPIFYSRTLTLIHFRIWEGRLVNPRIMGKSNLHYCGFVRFEHEDEETEIFSKYFKFYGFKWQILGTWAMLSVRFKSIAMKLDDVWCSSFLWTDHYCFVFPTNQSPLQFCYQT